MRLVSEARENVESDIEIIDTFDACAARARAAESSVVVGRYRGEAVAQLNDRRSPETA